MTLVTMGSDYFPRTAAGRALAWLLALYGFAVFGYITASAASFFVGRDPREGPGGAQSEDGEEDGPALHAEVRALRAEIAALQRTFISARRRRRDLSEARVPLAGSPARVRM